MKQLQKVGVGAGLGLGSLLASFSALAQDYSAITGAVDFDTAATAIGVVIGASAVMYVIWKGGKMVVNAIK